ncbi:MAG: L,D-transpeptidase, partial [Alphaproteobacteria bacterium]|nr:L,D-transpeptidase [Alphaproteobacteria bacterium]
WAEPQPGQPAPDPNAPINAQAIETAKLDPNNPEGSRELLVRIEVLLDRARFSPGEIDGRNGDNLKRALATYKQTYHIPNPGQLDDAALQGLTKTDKQPVLQHYTITAEDAKGPFLGTVPKDFRAMAKLKRIGYANPQEGLAEKFHMSPALLHTLNPNADFSKPGSEITVARPRSEDLPQVARVEVDKSANQLRAYDDANKIVAAFPATVGSTDRPAPSGNATVVSVAPDPTYTYDPKRVTFGPKSAGVLKIAAGPNNPVGSSWIALSVATYGIHGTPDPDLVGKTASHGCIRLTNWDAAALGKAVKKGMPVTFVGEEKPKPT